MADFELIILGTAAGIPEPNRTHSSLALCRNDDVWLLDAGEGTASALTRARIDPRKIRGIYITHLHSDHVIGIFMILQHLHVLYSKEHMDIHLPAKAIGAFQQFMNQIYLGNGLIHPSYELKPLENRHQLAEGITLETYPTRHLKEWQEWDRPDFETRSYAFRLITPDQTIFYSSDIDQLADLEPYLQSGDLLILEFAHIEADAILDLAQKLKLPRIILTHILPELREQEQELRARALQINLILDFAYDGYRISV